MTAQTTEQSEDRRQRSGWVKQEHDQDQPGEAVGKDVEGTVHWGSSTLASSAARMNHRAICKNTQLFN
jgi:hypothetical protein